MNTIVGRLAAGMLVCVLGLGIWGAGRVAHAQLRPVEITVGWQPYYTGAWSALVVKELRLWEKYLPRGSKVNWEVGLQGAIIVNNMLAGKQQIGYVGDMPAIVASTKRDQADIRLVALTGLSNQQCNNFVVRADAPSFTSAVEAVRWMHGKRVAVPKGSCTDRFAQQVFARLGVTPGEYLNQSIEVITANLRARRLDAAVLWEPTASRVGDIVGEGTARVVATGADFQLFDAGNVIMRKDFMDANPEVVVGWLKAEVEAQRFLVSNYPENACKVAGWAVANTTGLGLKQAWFALYGLMPVGRSKEAGLRMSARVLFDDAARKLLKESSDFLLEAKIIDRAMPADAIVEEPLRKALAELNVKPPLGAVRRQPVEAFPCKG
jgi:NitT/TauT family transport system substrate-binding protein